MYDDTTDPQGKTVGSGEIVEDAMGMPVLRVGKTPCETEAGCVKGHWRTWTEPTPGEKRVIEKYETCKATSGASLTASERKDSFLMRVFMRLDAAYRRIEANKLSNTLAMAMFGGSPTKREPRGR